jgi:hypothetical protein
MLAGRHQAGLPVLFGGEPFGGDVGDPDLHQLRALGAQLVPVCPRQRGPALAKLQPVNYQELAARPWRRIGVQVRADT